MNIWGIYSLKFKLIRAIPVAGINIELMQWIENKAEGKKLRSVKDICIFSNEIVSSRLSFDSDSKERNPNIVWANKKGNSLGYAALQVNVINYLLNKHEFKNWIAEVHEGETFLGNLKVGNIFSSLETHSYIYVTNTSNSENYYPDACLKDILFYGFIKEDIY